MSDTTFVNGTPIVPDWMNDVNDTVYDIIGDGTNSPTTKAQARDNLGLEIGVDVPSPTGTGASGNWAINATNVTGTVAIANGGTGQTTALAAFDALKQAASDSYSGVVEKLTSSEAQAGVDDTRYMSAATMKSAQIQLGTSVTLTSQTVVNFTSIPAWVKEINVFYSGVSTSGTSLPCVQLGTASGFETTGYLGSIGSMPDGATCVSVQLTTSFPVVAANSATVFFHGSLTLRLANPTTNTWVAVVNSGRSDSPNASSGGGSKALSAALTQIRFTTAGGVQTFDAGSVNISYA